MTFKQILQLSESVSPKDLGTEGSVQLEYKMENL